MKLYETISLVMEGTKLHLSTKEAPEWVKHILKNKGEGWNLASIEVEANPEPHLSHLDDRDVMDVYMHYTDGRVIKTSAANEDNVLYSDKKEQALYMGGKIKLWDDLTPGKPNMILITHTYGRHTAELLVHPNQMPKQLENKNNGLNDDEKKVLLITKDYVSSYRPEYLKRYNVYKNYDAIKASLTEKGLMTAAGALNMAGKNEVEKLRAENGGISALEKLFGYGD